MAKAIQAKRKSFPSSPKATHRPAEAGQWALDPKFSNLVKSQVDDVELVNHRRSQFVQTAIKLFSKKGYHGTTIKEVAHAAGVSPGLIYQYVTDKEDILFLALQLIVHTNRQTLPAVIAQASHPIEKFVVAFKEYCRVMDTYRDACMLTYRETKSLTREHREYIKGMEVETNEVIAECIRECISAGFFRQINVPVFVYQVIMIAHTWAIKHWRLSQLTTLDGYITANLDILLNSLATPEGKGFIEKFKQSKVAAPGFQQRKGGK